MSVFRKGDKVKLTALGHKMFKKRKLRGTVAFNHWGLYLPVILEGNKTANYYHPDFWELDEETK